jgi:hypothetical protein
VVHTSPSSIAALDAAERAVDRGRWGEAIEILSDAVDSEDAGRLEERLVELRRSASEDFHVDDDGRATRPPVSDRFSGTGQRPPEIQGAELTADLLESALCHHGALVVRGLLAPDEAGSLLGAAERALDAADAAEPAESAGAPEDPDARTPDTRTESSPWFKALDPGPSEPTLPIARRAARLGDSLLLAESPRALQRVISAYRRCGLGRTIADHLGEWPALSVTKSTIRRAHSGSATGWHQDGAFLGTDVRTVNVWTALTPAGVDAPGIQLFSQRFDHLADRGTDGARFHWSVSDEVAASYGMENAVSPAFEPGDALLFDQMLLHRTHVTPDMARTRIALETWFFVPSSYPGHEVPLRF